MSKPETTKTGAAMCVICEGNWPSPDNVICSSCNEMAIRENKNFLVNQRNGLIVFGEKQYVRF